MRIDAQWRFTEAGFDPVIYGEVDSPRWKITEDGRAETSVKSTQAIVLDNVANSGCSFRGACMWRNIIFLGGKRKSMNGMGRWKGRGVRLN